MVTLGVRVRVNVSVRVGTAFVLTLVPGSGMHLGLRFRRICVTYKLRVSVRVTVRVKCWGLD